MCTLLDGHRSRYGLLGELLDEFWSQEVHLGDFSGMRGEAAL
jgi:hypothetical protein